MRLVNAVAAVARSIAFLKRAVAISSIVRVILRMLRIDLRRLSSARALAIFGRVGCAHRLFCSGLSPPYLSGDETERVRIAVIDAFVGFHRANDRIDDRAND